MSDDSRLGGDLEILSVKGGVDEEQYPSDDEHQEDYEAEEVSNDKENTEETKEVKSESQKYLDRLISLSSEDAEDYEEDESDDEESEEIDEESDSDEEKDTKESPRKRKTKDRVVKLAIKRDEFKRENEELKKKIEELSAKAQEAEFYKNSFNTILNPNSFEHNNKNGYNDNIAYGNQQQTQQAQAKSSYTEDDIRRIVSEERAKERQAAEMNSKVEKEVEEFREDWNNHHKRTENESKHVAKWLEDYVLSDIGQNEEKRSLLRATKKLRYAAEALHAASKEENFDKLDLAGKISLMFDLNEQISHNKTASLKKSGNVNIKSIKQGSPAKRSWLGDGLEEVKVKFR